MTDVRLDGKVALVSGAASDIGIGRAITLALVRAGARVGMMDIDHEGLERTLAEALEAGGADCAIPIVADVSSWEDAKAAVAKTIEAFDGYHILVNNAGINPRTSGFWELEPETWSRAIGVNFTGPFMMARASVEYFRAQGWGRIIGITTSFSTMQWGAPYGPSKAGHEALIAAMARDLEGSGVTANALLPGGAVDTHMIPMDRDRSMLLKPEIMQDPVVWLASSESNGIHGRRLIAQDWDESLPIQQRIEKAISPVAWPQLGGPQMQGL
jgi:NAD(P)-dependent dehydrogenase (short-subunit alcohol dehydrogenase family)